MKTSLKNNLSILYYDRVNSVIDTAWEFLNDNTLKVWDSILADEQTNGRGQTGRNWSSPKGHLYVAIHLPSVKCFNNNCPSVIFGFLVAKALNALYSEEKIYLKWPNDLLNSKGHKIGGILTEIKKNNIIVGLGINLKKAPENFIRNNKAPQIDALNISDNPQILWTKLFEKIFKEFEKIQNFNLNDILGKVENLLLWKNKNIIIENPSSEPQVKEKILKGVITGLCKKTGALVVFNGINEYKIWSGSIYLT